ALLWVRIYNSLGSIDYCLRLKFLYTIKIIALVRSPKNLPGMLEPALQRNHVATDVLILLADTRVTLKIGCTSCTKWTISLEVEATPTIRDDILLLSYMVVGLNPNPLVNISGVIGTKALAFGLDVAFDTASGDFTKYNARVSHTNQDLTASLMLNKKGNTLGASHYHHVQLTAAVGAEIAHNFSSNENTITVGTQHELDPLTTLKGRYNNFGIVSALIQHAWRPMSLITFSTEVDTKAIEKSPKFGLALSPKP
ncbi:hypothetical protein ZWY2020_031977, partial [Hordeum vulgare]